MMALMAAAATTAFAQDVLIKDAKRLLAKEDFEQALQTLAPALTSAETIDKKGAWNLQSEICYGKYIAIQKQNAANQLEKKNEPFDTLGMHKAAIEAWKAALKCDEFDQMPDDKGKVKLKYRAAAQNKFKNHGVALVQAGQYFYQEKKDNELAFDAWKSYVDMKNSSLFAEVQDFPKDPFFYDIAYYTAILAYQMKNYPEAEKYAKITSEDEAKAGEATEILIFSKKETMKTKADSVAYVDMLKDLHKKAPEEERYFNLLMDFYTHAHNMEAMKAWAEEEIALNAENKMAWALKGEVQMNQNEWDAAVESYKKAIELDPDFVQCVFNAGVCLNSKAISMKDKLADKNTGKLTTENFNKIKAVLTEALGFMERARELDPNSEKVKWAYPLYQIYYAIGDKAKADEMEKLVNK